MKVLVVGGGGREHALAWALSKSSAVEEIVTAPGNPGTSALGDCSDISVEDTRGMVRLASRRRVGLAVIGPEAPLVAGLADALAEKGIPVFGPGRAGAQLEGSKSFAKSLMRKYGIPTAEARAFDRADDAFIYVDKVGGGVVVKADGLARGQGVTVCSTPEEAKAAIKEAILAGRFGDAGRRILIEERLEGSELSALAFCDGKSILMMQPARDYKRALDGDLGPNTGGMGSYSPVGEASTQLLERIIDEVLEPIAAGLEREGIAYKGVIYAGLMLTAEGPKVIEFNCRFGDPETQALVPRLASDITEVMLATIDGSLAGVNLSWLPQACVCVAAASSGYPLEDRTGLPILGLEAAEEVTGIPVFQAGTTLNSNGELVTSGGRTLGVSALGADLAEARNTAYRAMEKVSFEGIHYRRDIAAGEPSPQKGS